MPSASQSFCSGSKKVTAHCDVEAFEVAVRLSKYKSQGSGKDIDMEVCHLSSSRPVYNIRHTVPEGDWICLTMEPQHGGGLICRFHFKTAEKSISKRAPPPPAAPNGGGSPGPRK